MFRLCFASCSVLLIQWGQAEPELSASCETGARAASCADEDVASVLQVRSHSQPVLAHAATAHHTDSSQCPPPGFDSVADFNVADYISAPWYIQKQAEISYQPANMLYCVRANYTETAPVYPGSKLELIVDNYAREGSVSGSDQSGSALTLAASIKDLSDPSKLVVGPTFLPVIFRGPYWVVATSEQPYQWAIVSGGPPTVQGNDGCKNAEPSLFNANGNGEGLWLFTRDPVASEETVSMLVDTAKHLGFDTSVLLPVEQKGCCGSKYGVPCAGL